MLVKISTLFFEYPAQAGHERNEVERMLSDLIGLGSLILSVKFCWYKSVSCIILTLSKQKERSGQLKKLLLLVKNKELLKSLENILFSIDERIVVFSRRDVKEAYRCTVKMQIDLFIIDITLNADTVAIPPALRFVDKIRSTERYSFTPILFITEVKGTLLYRYDKLNCYKFINKPVDKYEFKRVVENSLIFLAGTQQDNMCYFQWNGMVYKINKNTVTYIQMIDEKLYIHTNDNKIKCAPYLSMKVMMQKLNSSDFVKCHRSTIVNMNYIKSVDINKQTIQLKDGLEKVSIGSTYVKYLKEIVRANG